MRHSWFLSVASPIIGVPIILAAQPLLAQESSNDLARFVAGALQAYVARCTPDPASQGMPPKKAEAVCTLKPLANSARTKPGSHLSALLE